MKNKRNTFVKTIKNIAIIFAITCSTSLSAQLPGPGVGPGPDLGGGSSNVQDATRIPLDGGLAILLLGAAAFGIRKLRGNRSDKLLNN